MTGLPRMSCVGSPTNCATTTDRSMLMSVITRGKYQLWPLSRRVQCTLYKKVHRENALNLLALCCSVCRRLDDSQGAN